MIRIKKENLRLQLQARHNHRKIMESNRQFQAVSKQQLQLEVELQEAKEFSEKLKRKISHCQSIRSRLRLETSEDFLRSLTGEITSEIFKVQMEGNRAVQALSSATDLIQNTISDHRRIQALMSELDFLSPVLENMETSANAPSLWR